MKWLKRKLYNWVRQGERLSDLELEPISINSVKTATVSSRGKSANIGNHNTRMNFTLHKANGGFVVEYSHYDERSDRHYESLHLIGSEEEFADSLAKIIFLECLKK